MFMKKQKDREKRKNAIVQVNLIIAAYTSEMNLSMMKKKKSSEKNKERVRKAKMKSEQSLVPGSFPGGLHY